MGKTRNNAWLIYGCIMVALGLLYIYDELKKPAKVSDIVEYDTDSSQEEEEDNDTGRA